MSGLYHGWVRSDERSGPGFEAAMRRLEEDAEQFREALKELGKALGSTRERHNMVAALLETAGRYLGARAGVFFLHVAGSEKLKPADAFVASADGIRMTDSAPMADNLATGEGLAGEAARIGRMVVWPPLPPSGPEGRGAGAMEPVSAAPVEPGPGEPAEGATTAVAVPLRPGGHTFGVVAFYGRMDDEPFSADHLDALAILAGQAETAVDRSFLYDEATRLSLTDGLTGLSNRRHFDLRLEAELSRAVRFSETFAVLMTDVDKFKPVNDTYGHQAGDTVLVELAGRMSGAVREVDLVARFGGDEFTFLLPKTGLAGALRLADKIRAEVSTAPFVVDDAPTTAAGAGGGAGRSASLSLSVGVAAYPEHGSSSRELVAAADCALYRAKARGGDQVEHARADDLPRPGTAGQLRNPT